MLSVGVYDRIPDRYVAIASYEEPTSAGVINGVPYATGYHDQVLVAPGHEYIGLYAVTPPGNPALGTPQDQPVATDISGVAASTVTVTSPGPLWLAGSDGSVFAFPSTDFYGSLPALGVYPAGPIVGICLTPDAMGYWLVGADGGVFAFGDAPFLGSAA